MVLFLALLCAVGVHGLAPLLETGDNVPGQFIVKIRSRELVSEFTKQLMEESIKAMQMKNGLGHVEVLFTMQADPTVLVMSLDYESLFMVRAHPAVAYVEEDGNYQLDDDEVDRLPESELARQPPSNWGLDRINQVEPPLDGNTSFSGNGFGVNIYVIDSGINDLHRDFECRARRAYDVFDSDGSDCKGHGTVVAGVAASATWGVAKAAMIHSVRTLDCRGWASTSYMTKGIDWVTANAKTPCVATMSFSRKTSSWAIDDAVKNLAKRGCLPIAAGTNEQSGKNYDACQRSPARSSYAITVGATTWTDDNRAWFTRFGTCVDIFAPGDFIRSTAANGNYVTSSGTSVAVPFVAGVAAFHLAKGMSAQEARNRILEDATTCMIPDAGRGSPNRLLYTDPGPN